MVAGRAIGRKMIQGAAGSTIHAASTQMRLGVPLAFVTAQCAYCDHLNAGVPCPEGGILDFGVESSSEGSVFAVPVQCDSCGKQFYLAWSSNPLEM
jgi:hypothetical protein